MTETARKKLILAFVIVNVLVILGFALMSLILGFTIEVVPTDDGFFSFDVRPLCFLASIIFVILGVIELFLGIFTYKGKKWAAITLILCELISWIGVFGVAAAIIVLKTPREDIKQQ